MPICPNVLLGAYWFGSAKEWDCCEMMRGIYRPCSMIIAAWSLPQKPWSPLTADPTTKSSRTNQNKKPQWPAIKNNKKFGKLTMKFDHNTSSTAQGGGGSFKNRKPIGEFGCCESGMAERSHWWTERCLISFTFSLSFSLCFSIFLWLSTDVPTDLSVYLSICLSVYLSPYLSIYLSIHLSIYLSIYLSV